MQHVPSNKAEGHKGQMTQNAIELQVLFRATYGSLLSAVCSIEHTCCRTIIRKFRAGVKGTYKMMSSTALPKVMFIRAPIVSPKSLATLSVA